MLKPALKSKTQPKRKQWTYEDYLNLPDDGRRYEIIEGVLYVGNAPNIQHQFTVMEIAFHLKLFISQHKLGYVLTAPFEVHLSETSHPVQPDILFIESSNWPGASAKLFEGAPDLIVEVLSPSTGRTDQSIKLTAYENAGVPEYWIANPKTRSVQVFMLAEGQYALFGEFTEDEVIESLVLAGVKIVNSSLFL